jgi:hypothetical protein
MLRPSAWLDYVDPLEPSMSARVRRTCTARGPSKSLQRARSQALPACSSAAAVAPTAVAPTACAAPFSL